MEFCDQLVIAVGVNPAKQTMFTEDERIKQINQSVDKHVEFLRSTNITVVSFQGLLVEYAKEIGAEF